MGLAAAHGAVSVALVATTAAACHSTRRTAENRQSDATRNPRGITGLEGVYAASQAGTLLPDQVAALCEALEDAVADTDPARVAELHAQHRRRDSGGGQ
jgi:hypothetical protein